MPMSYQDKETWAAEISDRVKKAKGGLVASFAGLKVGEIMEIRRAIRSASGEYRVVKNTLMRRAVAGTPLEGLDHALTQTTAVAFTYTEEFAKLGRVAKDLAKKFPKLQFKGGFVGQQVVKGEGAVEVLASLPTLEEARSQLLGMLNTPASKLLAQLNAPGQQVASVVDQYQKKLEKGA